MGTMFAIISVVIKPSISKHNIPLLYVINVLDGLKFTMPVWILFLQQSLTNGQISILASILFFSSLVFELPTGAFADLLGKKSTIITGFLVSVVATILFTILTSFQSLIIVFILMGLGEALVSGAFEALVYDSLKQDGREKEFRGINAKLMYVMQIGFVGGTVLGGVFGNIDLRLPFMIYAGLQLVVAIVTMFVREPDIDSEKFTLKNYLNQTVLGFKQLTKSEFIKWLSILYMLVGGISWVFQRLIVYTSLIDLGYSGMDIGFITGFFRLLNILILVKLLRMLHKKVGYGDLLLLPLLMVFFYMPGMWLTKFVALPFIGGGMLIATARFVLLSPYVNEEVESKYRATAISAMSMLVSLVYIVSTFLIGTVFENLSPMAIFTVFGIFALVVMVPVGLKVKRLAELKNNP